MVYCISVNNRRNCFANFIWGCRYAKFNIGSPPQEVEVDLNMLISDFYVMTTTSRVGNKYDDYFSQSVGMCQSSPKWNR